MGVLAQEERIPRWLHQFLVREYFSHCPYHSYKKNERNYFCIECIEGPLCRIGLQEHNDHVTLQVRRASHMDAVRVHDVQNLIDIYNIQTYSINGAKIVFLLCRPQHKIVKNAPYSCFTCKRPLPEDVMFCCISCKLSSIHTHTDGSATLCFPESNFKANVDPCTTYNSSPAFCCSDQGKNSNAMNAFAEIYPREFMCCSSQHSNVDQLQRPLKKRRLEIMATAAKDYEQRHENLFDLCHDPRPLSESGGEESSFHGMDRPVGRFYIERCEGLRVRRRKGNPRRSPFT